MKYWLLGVSSRPDSAWVSLSKDLGNWDGQTFTIETKHGICIGDAVAFWRGGRTGGVVALGRVADKFKHVDPFLHAVENAFSGSRKPVSDGKTGATVVIELFSFGAPLTTERLRHENLDAVAKSGTGTAVSSMRGELVELRVTEVEWRHLASAVGSAEQIETLPLGWTVPVGAIVSRADLHGIYGGDPRTCAGPSGKTPNTFLFVECGSRGDISAEWNYPILTAPGRAQSGEAISNDNLAIISHQSRCIPLRVFLSDGVNCLYAGEFLIDSVAPIERWVSVGKQRRGGGSGSRNRSKFVDVSRPVFRLRPTKSALPELFSREAPFEHAIRIELGLRTPSDEPAANAVHMLMRALEAEPEVIDALNKLDEAQLLAALVQQAKRQSDLNELRRIVENPSSSESDIQKSIERMTWIFGGEFLPGTGKRNLTPRDELDLVLLRPDGTLHGVELKKANLKSGKLIKSHRNHLIPGLAVHEAVCQAENYLRELDEKRPEILADFGIDCRRASISVVIGHRMFINSLDLASKIDETLRTYNASRSRVNVITYDRLIENAQRVLEFSGHELGTAQ